MIEQTTFLPKPQQNPREVGEAVRVFIESLYVAFILRLMVSEIIDPVNKKERCLTMCSQNIEQTRTTFDCERTANIDLLRSRAPFGNNYRF